MKRFNGTKWEDWASTPVLVDQETVTNKTISGTSGTVLDFGVKTPTSMGFSIGDLIFYIFDGSIKYDSRESAYSHVYINLPSHDHWSYSDAITRNAGNNYTTPVVCGLVIKAISGEMDWTLLYAYTSGWINYTTTINGTAYYYKMPTGFQFPG